jgi:AAA family ATP:ADP antiporter
MKNFESSVKNVFQEAFQYFLNKSFDIRVGEYRRVILMQINIFLIISTLLIIKPIVNSLFLSSFGYSYLPTAFIIVSLFAVGISWLYSRLLSKYPFDKIMTRTLLISVITLFLFGLLLRLNILVQVVLLLFYVWVALFAVVSSSQFWVLANIVFNAREAKRVFGFIGAGAIAGGIFGGYLTSIMAPLIGSENLIFLSMLVLLPTIWITKKIWKKRNSEQQRVQQQKIQEEILPENPYQLIKKSRHLTLMAGIIGVSVIVAKLVDYQFSAIASMAILDPDKLTAFFGFWFSNFNLLSLFIQLFLTRRIVGVFGVGSSLLILPGAIFLGALGMLFFPILGAAIFIKLCDGSLKQSLNKSATELLALPIPLEIKSKTKSFIDVTVDSVASGIGGLLLFFLVNGLQLSTNWISLMIIGLLTIWIYFALQVRKEYLKSFKLKISKKVTRKKVSKKIESAESVISNLQKQLKSTKEKHLLYIIQKTREIPREEFYLRLKNLLSNESGKVRAEAINSLKYYLNHNLSGDMILLVNDNDQQVRVSAFEYLIALAPGNRVKLIESYLEHEDSKIQESALIALAIETRGNLELQNWFSFGDRLQERIQQMTNTKDPNKKKELHMHILKVIGASCATGYFSYLQNAFTHKNEEIVSKAIEAAGVAGHPQFISVLVGFLNKGTFLNTAQTALANYSSQVFPVFYKLIKEDKISVELVRKLPAIAQKVNRQKSIEFLFFLFNYEDYMVHLESLKALNNIKLNFPHLYFDKKLVMSRIVEETTLYQNSLIVLNSKFVANIDTHSIPFEISDARKSLIDILGRRLDGSLERIFRLLELRYPPEDILTVYKGIQSDKDDLRMNAVEFLDNLLEARLKKMLIPVLETAILNTMAEPVSGLFAEKEPDEFECYRLLLEGIDVKLKLAVFYLLEQLGDRKFLPLVQTYLNAENKKIRTFAEKAQLAMLAD